MVGGQQGTLGTSRWGEGALGQGLYLMPGSHVLSAFRAPRTCGFAEVPSEPVHNGPREPHGTHWGSPSTHGHVHRRVPVHGPWCRGEGGPEDTLSKPKAASCGHRSERWGPQGQGTFANTTLNVNQLALTWYL